ncbi:hypothetical protein CYLTODRAFT_484718 [Cylindrobasidium torrendii FP15055 ss-10]|uniref:HAMP domain-containing protein n=1 Tax=Cylindrobasidium torrendii FP15055 ss-10 TaxID=1314674 RepID=A0A0D7BXM5_9AGAR|nr:hypothetical protein CYLTODRAFT_484718 [Cylindrobasidium torrendii FP15055 ss-10]
MLQASTMDMSTEEHPFFAYLCTALSAPLSSPLALYNGPTSSKTETIQRNLSTLFARLKAAEDAFRSKGIETPLISQTEQATDANAATMLSEGAPAPKSESPDLAVRDTRLAPSNPLSQASTISAPASPRIDHEVCSHCGAPATRDSKTAERGLTATDELELLKTQVQDVARVCNSVAIGDLSKKITIEVHSDAMSNLKAAVNSMVDRLGQFAQEVTSVSLEVGTQGILGGQAHLPRVEGTWLELTNVVNKLAADLTLQVRCVAEVTKAVARGDLSRLIEIDARGELLDMKNTVNGMVLRLRALTSEVLRVTREVGIQGEPVGLENVPDIEGVWLELLINVNQICSFKSLTDQVPLALSPPPS